MFFLWSKSIIFVNCLQDASFCICPLCFDISQCLENSAVKIHRRKLNLFAYPALRHFILDSISRINFQKTAHAAVSLVCTIFYISVVPGNFLQFTHIFCLERLFIILAYRLINLILWHSFFLWLVRPANFNL